MGIATVKFADAMRGWVIAPGWGDQLVTIRALLLLGGMSLALASAASAQSAGPPPSVSPPDTIASPPPATAPAAPPTVATAPAAQPGLPPQRISAMVRAHGFNPIGHPVRHGNLYVQRALDPDDMEYRLVIDSVTGRTLSVRPMGMAGPYAYAPGPYGPPPYRPARFFGPPPPDDYGFGYGTPRPPRAVPGARLAPPQTQPAQQSQPQQRTQPSTTAQAPLPRPKPYVAEATGSIPVESPASPTPQKAPEPQKAPAPPQQNGAAAMAPVAPLD
jgi:hypothetical protein